MSTPTRAEINRANAEHSTGPRSAAGKQRSSENSFKHGLYSTRLILPGECAAEFDRLRAKMRAEHQPANTTEEILVDDLAQNFWRMRRFQAFEAAAWQPDRLEGACEVGILPLAMRALASAERSFHRSLTALRRLQKDRGFVPSNTIETPAEADPKERPHSSASTAAENFFPPTRYQSDLNWMPAGFVPPNLEDLPCEIRK